jgi:hypothetical protein
MWGYESLDDRQRRRAELGSNAEFQGYLREVVGFFMSQESKILLPAPFFSPKS